MSPAYTRIFASIAVLASGCGATPSAGTVCALPASIEVAVESGPLLNPDASGRPLPTEVRLYRVRDTTPFETVTFEALWQSDADALGASLLGVESVTVYPGETTTSTIVPEPEAQAIVAMAIVREPAGRTWRTVVDVESMACGASAHLRLRVDEYRIERTSLASEED